MELYAKEIKEFIYRYPNIMCDINAINKFVNMRAIEDEVKKMVRSIHACEEFFVKNSEMMDLEYNKIIKGQNRDEMLSLIERVLGSFEEVLGPFEDYKEGYYTFCRDDIRLEMKKDTLEVFTYEETLGDEFEDKLIYNFCVWNDPPSKWNSKIWFNKIV